tara:strand:- start:81 stop:287 length:207 start_codon:yes stop_codon:yes gene_type:complete
MRNKSSFDQEAKKKAIDKAMPEEESVDDVAARLKAQQEAERKARIAEDDQTRARNIARRVIPPLSETE